MVFSGPSQTKAGQTGQDTEQARERFPRWRQTPPGLTQDLCLLSLQAGAAIMVHYGNGVNAGKKDDKSAVTIGDHDAQKLLLDGFGSDPHRAYLSSANHAVACGHFPEIAERLTPG